MIIVLSGWRGTRETQQEILDATADVLRRLFVRFPDAQYRRGDCKTGVDWAVDYLWRKQYERSGWFTPQVKGRRGIEKFSADWSHGPVGGPERNEAMLRGDGTTDLRHGFARLLVAMPQPGPRPPKGSGTWGCVDIAHRLGIPVEIAPLRPIGDWDADRLPLLPRIEV